MKPKFVMLDGGPLATTMAWASAGAHCSLNVTKRNKKKSETNPTQEGDKKKH